MNECYTWRMKQKLIEIDGRLANGPELARMLGIPWQAVYQRLQRGWSATDAFSTPIRQSGTPVNRNSVDAMRAQIARHRAAMEWHAERANALQRRVEKVVANTQQYDLDDDYIA